MAKRYHTSKIRTFEDITTVTSMGFRGEALNSIASLCKSLSITTKTAEEDIATTYEFDRQGDITSSRISSGETGTMVTAERIFFHLPVRRQTASKEAYNNVKAVQDTLIAYSIILPTIRFMLQHFPDNTASKGKHDRDWIKPAVNSEIDAVRLLFGNSISRNVEQVEICGADYINKGIHNISTEHLQYTDVLMSIILPRSDCDILEVCKSDIQFFYLNTRPIKPIKSLAKLIKTKFREHLDKKLQQHKLPLFILHLKLPPQFYDINLEPSKETVALQGLEKIEDILNQFLDSQWRSATTMINVQEEQNILKSTSHPAPVESTLLTPCDLITDTPLSKPKSIFSESTLCVPTSKQSSLSDISTSTIYSLSPPPLNFKRLSTSTASNTSNKKQRTSLSSQTRLTDHMFSTSAVILNTQGTTLPTLQPAFIVTHPVNEPTSGSMNEQSKIAKYSSQFNVDTPNDSTVRSVEPSVLSSTDQNNNFEEIGKTTLPKKRLRQNEVSDAFQMLLSGSKQSLNATEPSQPRTKKSQKVPPKPVLLPITLPFSLDVCRLRYRAVRQQTKIQPRHSLTHYIGRLDKTRIVGVRRGKFVIVDIQHAREITSYRRLLLQRDLPMSSFASSVCIYQSDAESIWPAVMSLQTAEIDKSYYIPRKVIDVRLYRNGIDGWLRYDTIRDEQYLAICAISSVLLVANEVSRPGDMSVKIMRNILDQVLQQRPSSSKDQDTNSILTPQDDDTTGMASLKAASAMHATPLLMPIQEFYRSEAVRQAARYVQEHERDFDDIGFIQRLLVNVVSLGDARCVCGIDTVQVLASPYCTDEG